jgi:hypothetical protein
MAWTSFFGLAFYMLQRQSEALPSVLEYVSRAPNLRDAYVWLAAARLEQPEQARIEPTYAIQRTAKPSMRFRSTSEADHPFERLHTAGLPWNQRSRGGGSSICAFLVA